MLSPFSPRFSFLCGLLKFPPETKRARHTEGWMGDRVRLLETGAAGDKGGRTLTPSQEVTDVRGGGWGGGVFVGVGEMQS